MIKLRKMTEEEFECFKEYSIADYAQDLIRGEGLDSETAVIRAESEFNETLPGGLETRGQFLMTILDEESGKAVGSIWFFYEEEEGIRQLWLADFLIHEEYRGKGYGRAALSEMERRAREAGCITSALYAWDHNPAGYSLYRSCGYETFIKEQGGALMKKRL